MLFGAVFLVQCLVEQTGMQTMVHTGNDILNKTDDYTATVSGDSITYKYSSVHITEIEHKGEVGNKLIVLNTENNSSVIIDKGGIFFLGIIDRYLLVVAGTGSMRGLLVYDLVKQKLVFENGYFGNIEIENNTLVFRDQVYIKDDSRKPQCS